MENDPGVRPIVSAEQIPPALLTELHALLLAANQAHDPNRTEVAVEEIDIFFRLVFEDQDEWNSSMLPSIPVHRRMEARNHGVIGPIGHFLQDLPSVEHPSLRVAGADGARKKGCAAFCKADFDANTGVLRYMFLDDNNNTVAADQVACQNGPGILSAHELATAIRIMDHDVEHLDNYWNEDLAIHLFQKILYDHTHPDTPYDPEQYGHTAYTADNFIRPRRIRDVYRMLEDANEDVAQIIESHPKTEFFVPSL
ncbi:hypothetical protein KJ359_008470 [Pestalotiopsis sp. 9143b]|nr:hypothetical protein KJ359_008470 [Pestalotiopsis sp. 9143b]